MDTYMVVSRHPEDLHDGSLHGPGAEVNLSAEDQKEPHNAALIEDGRLVRVKQETAAERKAREKAEKEAADKAAAESGDNGNNGGDS